MDRTRSSFVAMLLLASALIMPTLLTAPATADDEPPGTCVSGRAADSCANSNETDHSVTVSWSAARINPECGDSGVTNCVYSYQVIVGQRGYNHTEFSYFIGGASTNCPGTTMTGQVGGGDFKSVGAATVSCTTTFSWSHAAEYPTSWSIQLIEQDGGGSIAPGGTHGFSFNRPDPHPHAAFTITEGDDVCEYTFTSTSTTRAGVIHANWYSPAKPDEDIPVSGAVNQNVWQHTFPKPGTYEITLSVSDASSNDDEVTQEVTCGAHTGRSTTLTVKVKTKPKADPGRFKVKADGKVAIAKAKNGDQKLLNVSPGAHSVKELAAKGTKLKKYGVHLTCTVGGTKQVNKDAKKGTVVLKAGDNAVCTFKNKKK